MSDIGKCKTCGEGVIPDHFDGKDWVHAATGAAWCYGHNTRAEPLEPQPYTQEDLFLGAWEGPINPLTLYTCSLCGCPVVEMDTHTTWHNSQR